MDGLHVVKDAFEWLGLAALVGVLTLCVAGLFSSHYHDNWLQFLGLWTIVLADTMRLAWLAERWQWRGELVMSWPMIVLHIGMLMFAVGTACKVWRHRRRLRPA
ncbi:MAG: hypothetical protein HS128_23515 [Ideonella sp.]|nr:hypothetical protein [Ideonella sp.]